MIALNNIEMPKTCYECQFRSTEPSEYGTFHCTAIDGSVKYPDHKNSRVPLCPLIPMINVTESVYDKLHDDATQNRKE